MLESLLLLCALPHPAQQGLVEIPAGSTLVGADLAEQKKLIAAKPAQASYLGADTPRTKVEVNTFRMGTTEVTNEMYLQFVKRTGYQPPVSWLKITAEERIQLIAEQQKEDPSWIFEGLYKSKWWDENWKKESIQWGMPPEQALFPVIGVSWQDARAYCRWAGLRLPTEQEWVRAARGDDERHWPFGNEFDRKLVACRTTLPKNLAYKLLPINTFPENASAFGLVDMCGNVWEWTDSKFGALPGFKSFRIKDDNGKKVDVLPAFDASSPVIKGGAFNIPDYGTAIDRRLGVFDIARVDFIGFRVASTPATCYNASLYMRDSLDARILGASPEDGLETAGTLGLEKRRYGDLAAAAATRAAPGQGIPESTPPENYVIYDRYDCIFITPLGMIEENSVKKLQRITIDGGPAPIGVLCSSVPLSTPNVLPGSYILAYQGPLKEKEIIAKGATVASTGESPAEDAESPGEDHPDYSGLQLDPKLEYIMVINDQNVVVAALTPNSKSGMGSSKKSRHEIVLNLDKQRLDFKFRVLDARARKAFTFSIPIVPISMGEDLLSRDFWEGSYTIKEPEEEK